MKNSFTKIINIMGGKITSRTDEILNNIELINLKQTLIEYEDEEGKKIL